MSHLLVSVLLPVYNAGEPLGAAIESILRQTLADFELIIIDDGSTDKSSETISRYETRDKRIKHITHRGNQGLVAALNEGLELARGEFFARQDADDLSRDQRLEKQVAFLQANPAVGLVGSNYEAISGRGNVIMTTNVFTHPADLRLAEIFSNQFGHGTIMARTKVMRDSGGYRADYPHAEDYELFSRLAHSTQLANLKEPLYEWRVSESQVTARHAGENQQQRLRIIDREFDYYLANRHHYRLFSLHPFSTRLIGADYLRRKNTLMRDMAIMYCRKGLRRRAVPILLLAVICAPWVAKTYRQLYTTLFRKHRIPGIEYEYI